MQNLAGNRGCDTVIEQELQRCGIPIVQVERRTGEVPASIIGKLGPFTFIRAWHYWMVGGAVPLAVAKELYADPVGKAEVRVAGHCGCPPPEKPWVTLVAPDGRQVVDATERKLCQEIFRDRGSMWDSFNKEYVFSDDPASHGAREYVLNYHIDSEAGLRLFTDTIRKHGLDKQ